MPLCLLPRFVSTNANEMETFKEKYLKMQQAHIHSIKFSLDKPNSDVLYLYAFLSLSPFSIYVICTEIEIHAVNWSACSWELMQKMLTMNFFNSQEERISSNASNEQTNKRTNSSSQWEQWKIRSNRSECVVICTIVYVLLVSYMISTHVVALWTWVFIKFHSFIVQNDNFFCLLDVCHQ